MHDIYQKKGPTWKISTEYAIEVNYENYTTRNQSKESISNLESIPKIKDIIGEALSKIGTFHNLSTEEQVVALINDVRTNIISI